jgi:hypothetical protein
MTSFSFKPSELTDVAHAILIADLIRYGNNPGTVQKAALHELLDTMTGYAFGTQLGRQAFGLPTGFGKTSALVAWIAALYKVGPPDIAVSVATSKVDALCNIHRALVERGVPEVVLGIKHSLPLAAVASTGTDDRRFQLVTHARVRGGSDHDLFIRHNGVKRSLMIYDETLSRSDTFAVAKIDFDVARGAFEGHLPYLGAAFVGVAAYLQECRALINEAFIQVGMQTNQEVTIQLPPRSQQEIDGYIALLTHASSRGQSYDPLLEILRMSQDRLRLITTSQSTGVLCYKIVVPEDLSNVLILDASYPIRKLVHLDETIKPVGAFQEQQVKRFDDLEVFQMSAHGGRHSMTSCFRHRQSEDRWVSKEVIEVVKTHGHSKGVLIFTYKSRDVDMARLLKEDMQAAGIDVEERMSDGRQRINLLTWGDETSLNGLEHCEVVIMAGVLHRSYLDLASSILGQKDLLTAKVDKSILEEVLRGEICHLIYQGASRGACRRVNEGQSLPMKLFILHKDILVQRELQKVLPGAKWQQWQPAYETSVTKGVADRMVYAILSLLQSLDENMNMISTKKVKAILGLDPSDGAQKKAFSRAATLVMELDAFWTFKRRSFVRVPCPFKMHLVRPV